MRKVTSGFTRNGCILVLISLLLPQSVWSCGGCAPDVWPKVTEAAIEINQRHAELENAAKDKYEEKILPRLEQIDCLQDQIVQVSVHMAALEKEANLDEKKLLHILRKNVDHRTNTAGESQ